MAQKGNEVEGKWLNPVGWAERVVQRYEIQQGYVARDPNGTIVRVRKRNDEFFHTVKGKPISPGNKPERERQIDAAFFDDLWPFTLGRRIEKVRFVVPILGHIVLGEAMDLTAEIDVFGGALLGLVMAEVEVPTAEHLADLRANKPDWFGEDVTDDVRYGNDWLSSNGIPGILDL